jgi:hypothetical protein
VAKSRVSPEVHASIKVTPAIAASIA